jgi:adenosylcobinamide kinase / adenosylcobinamide-phosphate guanylyltransferase
MAELRVARSELILGGQNTGKTARAEMLAAVWLDESLQHRAVYIATAQAWDVEMRERISRHQRLRAERMPRMETMEEPRELAQAIGRHSRADTLIVVDCLTLWLTAQLMPAVPGGVSHASPAATIAGALRACAGPIILISNEFAPDSFARGEDARAFVDALGGLNQQAAAACERVTLMSAGQPLLLKGSS